jgi:hypothetical protein
MVPFYFYLMDIFSNIPLHPHRGTILTNNRESDFSADVKNEIIIFEQKSFLENLKEIRDALVKQAKQ